MSRWALATAGKAKRRAIPLKSSCSARVREMTHTWTMGPGDYEPPRLTFTRPPWSLPKPGSFLSQAGSRRHRSAGSRRTTIASSPNTARTSSRPPSAST